MPARMRSPPTARRPRRTPSWWRRGATGRKRVGTCRRGPQHLPGAFLGGCAIRQTATSPCLCKSATVSRTECAHPPDQAVVEFAHVCDRRLELDSTCFSARLHVTEHAGLLAKI